jgi:hypothetical protein
MLAMLRMSIKSQLRQQPEPGRKITGNGITDISSTLCHLKVVSNQRGFPSICAAAGSVDTRRYQRVQPTKQIGEKTAD